MKINQLHDWNLSLSEAFKVQKHLASRVVCQDFFQKPIKRVAGIDAGYDKSLNLCKAVAVVLSFPELELIELAEAQVPVEFPYIPGFLSFREAPAIVKALQKLQTEPDLILCDGQGVAHPRRFGIACHIGLLVGKPTIGVAKSLLFGEYKEPEDVRGSFTYLKHKSETIGVVVRTKDKVKPLYISVGHLISLETSVSYVLECTRRYRIPEPIRVADRVASNR